MEQFKKIKDFGGKYQVSTKGRVKSFVNTKPIFLSPQLTDTGYYVVNITYKGKVHRPKIHRLVAKSFIKNPKHRKFVHHKDHVRTNNNKSNLKWVTPSENTKASYKMRKSLGISFKGKPLHDRLVDIIKEFDCKTLKDLLSILKNKRKKR